MFHFTQGRLSCQLSLLRKSFFQNGDHPFADVLSVAAVSWLLAFRAARGQSLCSAGTSTYCEARARLPEEFFVRLVRNTSRKLHDEAKDAWLWKDRRVKIFDGSTVSMPDTPENQAAYPQHEQQAPGVGFPLARIAVVFSLCCGAALDLAVCRYSGKGQSELGLLRQLWQNLVRGDVLLTDRYLCSYMEIALLLRRGVDFVGRLHQARRFDFRRGRRLGPDDHLVEWAKPKRPNWMDEETYRQLPPRMTMREIRVRVTRPGFRTRELIVVTTLLNEQEFTRDDLAELYRLRWHAELDLRSLKTALEMDVLRGKTPEMVRKEIWVHLLGYNLIRALMARAADAHDLPPRSLSFKGALQLAMAFHVVAHFVGPQRLSTMNEALIAAIRQHSVGNRPNRIEPRARKRRPKPYKFLMQPRQQARNLLLKSRNA
jgi:hypothetical protein